MKHVHHGYDSMKYNRCGSSGLQLPAISLGLWQFPAPLMFLKMDGLSLRRFDRGITHFDLANNYGPVPGSAEENFGIMLAQRFPGYLLMSWSFLQSWLPDVAGALRRMGLRNADIQLQSKPVNAGLDHDRYILFASARSKPPLEETMMALDTIVRQGQSFVYWPIQLRRCSGQKAIGILKSLVRHV